MQEVILFSTDLSTSRRVRMADVHKTLFLLGGNREAASKARSMVFASGSTNILNILDEHGKFICAIGYDAKGQLRTQGLFICG